LARLSAAADLAVSSPNQSICGAHALVEPVFLICWTLSSQQTTHHGIKAPPRLALRFGWFRTSNALVWSANQFAQLCMLLVARSGSPTCLIRQLHSDMTSSGAVPTVSLASLLRSLELQSMSDVARRSRRSVVSAKEALVVRVLAGGALYTVTRWAALPMKQY
jgi:hypothetical protein